MVGGGRGVEVVVAWHEDDLLQLPGVAEAAVMVDLPLGNAARAKVTHALTEAGLNTPLVETLAVAAGKIRLRLDSGPVFVEMKQGDSGRRAEARPGARASPDAGSVASSPR